jgi:proteasome lid subunit RPN8/RPN11
MRVHISQELFDVILHHSRVRYPLEAYGLIAGSVGEKGKVIKKVYPLPNPKQSHGYPSAGPQERQKAEKDMRSLNLSPLGTFHSHPETPALPNDEEIESSKDPTASYLILSLKTTTPVLKSFLVDKKLRQVEEEILVVGQEGEPAE